MSETDRLTAQVITRKSGHTSNWRNVSQKEQEHAASSTGITGAANTVITQDNLGRPCRVHVTTDPHLQLDMPTTWWPDTKPPAWCISLHQATLLAGLSSTVSNVVFWIFLNKSNVDGHDRPI